MTRIRRGGTYYRVCNPDWTDCADTRFSLDRGGRWNPPRSFGTLYLNRTVELAAAQARWNYRDEAFQLFDLRQEARPDLQEFVVEDRLYVDAVTDEGLEELGLPTAYPFGAQHSDCQPIGQRLYDAGERGIASRSAVECAAPGDYLDEELALFERPRAGVPAKSGRRRSFAEWYESAGDVET